MTSQEVRNKFPVGARVTTTAAGHCLAGHTIRCGTVVGYSKTDSFAVRVQWDEWRAGSSASVDVLCLTVSTEVRRWKVIGWYSQDETDETVAPTARVTYVEAATREEAFAMGERALANSFVPKVPGIYTTLDLLNWYVKEVPK